MYFSELTIHADKSIKVASLNFKLAAVPRLFAAQN